MKLIRTQLLATILLLSINLSAIELPSYLAVSPGISCGYTFGKGWNAGLYTNIGIGQQQLNGAALSHGLNVSYTFFTHAPELYSENLYRVLSLNYVASYDKLAIVKLGLAKTKLKWGVDHRNTKRSSWGLNFQAEAMPLRNGLLVGFRYFQLKDQCMGIGGREPKFIYAAYQYNLLESLPAKNKN